MKKRIAKICASFLILLLAVIVTGCGGSSLRLVRNKRPDDDISKAICEAVGRKKVHYYGKQYFKSGEIALYEYEVHDYEDENLLTDMVEAVNAAMKEKAVTKKMVLIIQEEFVVGAYRTVVSLRNYYETEDGYEQYESLQWLGIYGTVHESGTYNKASTYINLSDIKRLVVTEEIAQNAEDEGIDWYEIWPDLEYYEVLDPNDRSGN